MRVILSKILCFLVAALPTLYTAASEQTKLTLLLDWFVNPNHAALVVAQEKGFFTAQQLAVHMVPPSDPSAPPRLIAAGKGDIAVTYQPQLHLQIAQGLPLLRIATLVATPLNTLVVLEQGPIKTIADLRDKRVGYSVGGFESVILTAMLGQADLTLEDIALVNVNFALSPSLYSGKVDAVIGAFRNFELNQMRLADRTGRAFYVEEYGVPIYDELILVIHNKRLNDAAFTRFVMALEQATQWLINHPQQAWSLFIKAYPLLDDTLNHDAWRDTLPRLALRPAALDSVRYQRFAQFMQLHGMIRKIPPVADYAVQLNP